MHVCEYSLVLVLENYHTHTKGLETELNVVCTGISKALSTCKGVYETLFMKKCTKGHFRIYGIYNLVTTQTDDGNGIGNASHDSTGL